MATKFDEAVALLYRAPLEKFVVERKRLGSELALSGDKPAAALFGKLPRPSVSAWATNQLFWQEQPKFEALFASAARLRAGDLDAAAEHRKQSTTLVNRAAGILKDEGHAASETTLRRVAANLAALAATGSFAPDAPGALKSDRDPPGFDAFTLDATLGSNPSKAERTVPTPAAHASEKGESTRVADKAAQAAAKAAAARARAAAEEERRRAAEERARVRAERRELEASLRTVKTAIERRTQERDRLKGELAIVESELEQALASEQAFTQRLAELPSD